MLEYKNVTIQTDHEEVAPIMAWKVEAALRKVKHWKEAGKVQVNIETLKAGDATIVKQLSKLYTKFTTGRRIPKTWKEVNMVIFGSRKGTENTSRTTDQFACYQVDPLCTNCSQKIITTRLENKRD